MSTVGAPAGSLSSQMSTRQRNLTSSSGSLLHTTGQHSGAVRCGHGAAERMGRQQRTRGDWHGSPRDQGHWSAHDTHLEALEEAGVQTLVRPHLCARTTHSCAPGQSRGEVGAYSAQRGVTAAAPGSRTWRTGDASSASSSTIFSRSLGNALRLSSMARTYSVGSGRSARSMRRCSPTPSTCRATQEVRTRRSRRNVGATATWVRHKQRRPAARCTRPKGFRRR